VGRSNSRFWEVFQTPQNVQNPARGSWVRAYGGGFLIKGLLFRSLGGFDENGDLQGGDADKVQGTSSVLRGELIAVRLGGRAWRRGKNVWIDRGAGRH